MNTQLLVDDTYLDLYDDVPVPVSYAIADVREPEKRKGSHSKTIILPGTAVNNKFFTHVFDLGYVIQTSGTTNFDPDFNPNLKVSATLFQFGIPVLKGDLQLLKINITEDEIEYEVALIANMVSLYAAIGDNELTDLDLSAFDHTLSYTSIVNSWSAAVGEGYVYPMIDYGMTDLQRWHVEHWFPAIYVKEYVDAIFSAAGWTFTSAFFDSDFFKRLIVPINTDRWKLTQTQIDNRTFKATRTQAANQVVESAVKFNGYTDLTGNILILEDDSTGTNHDDGGVYDTATGKFTAAGKNWYEVHASVQMFVNFNMDSSFYLLHPIMGIMWIIKEDAAGVLTNMGNAYIRMEESLPCTLKSASTVGTTQTFTLKTNAILLNIGDKIWLRGGAQRIPGSQMDNFFTGISCKPQTTEVGGQISFRMKGGAVSTFEVKIINAAVLEGDTVSVNDTIPLKVKQNEFITSLFKAFNLMAEPDKDKDRNLIIEPREDWYNTTVEDWTDKRDTSRPLVETPMGELDFKSFVFTHKKDADYFNKKYEENYGKIYGQKDVDVVNDFSKKERKNELIFSPTPSVGSYANDRVLPAIVQKDINGVVSTRTSNIRMLYYGGLVASDAFDVVASSGITAHSSYPYAGHLDSIANPTRSILFGVPREIYWTADKYTNDNLYNRFWKKYIDEITHRDSKLIRGWFWLTPADIHQLDMRRLFRFDGHNFRLNKIIDYDANANEPTECEFLKVREGTTFSATQSDVTGAPVDDVPLRGDDQYMYQANETLML